MIMANMWGGKDDKTISRHTILSTPVVCIGCLWESVPLHFFHCIFSCVCLLSHIPSSPISLFYSLHGKNSTGQQLLTDSSGGYILMNIQIVLPNPNLTATKAMSLWFPAQKRMS